MKVEKIYKSGSFASNMYLITDGKYGVVIDPSHDFSAIRYAIEEQRIAVTHCLLTHAHFDHFLALESILKNTDAKLYLGKNDADAIGDSRLNCYYRFLGVDVAYHGAYKELCEGDTLSVGDLVIEVLEIPGHTKGSIAYHIGDALFVGDLIFEGGGYGRCDLPGGDFETLVQSIERICALPPETVVYPGHGNSFYLSQYKPYF